MQYPQQLKYKPHPTLPLDLLFPYNEGGGVYNESGQELIVHETFHSSAHNVN